LLKENHYEGFTRRGVVQRIDAPAGRFLRLTVEADPGDWTHFRWARATDCRRGPDAFRRPKKNRGFSGLRKGGRPRYQKAWQAPGKRRVLAMSIGRAGLAGGGPPPGAPTNQKQGGPDTGVGTEVFFRRRKLGVSGQAARGLAGSAD